MITGIERPHPVRVGVDGFSAAGKSTLADELAAAMVDHGRTCLRPILMTSSGHGLSDLQAQLAYTVVRSISTRSALSCCHPSGQVGIGASA
jgi:GTPase